MKKTIIYLLPMFVLGILGSCDNDSANKDCGVELKLVQVIGSIANEPPKTGDDMSFQESIFLYNDSSFTKRKTDDGVTAEESGMYTNKRFDNDTREYLELTYHTPKNALIESCTTADSKEYLFVLSDSKFQGTWSACDGPTLVYEKNTVSCQD